MKATTYPQKKVFRLVYSAKLSPCIRDLQPRDMAAMLVLY